jgi:hypothetical protein
MKSTKLSFENKQDSKKRHQVSHDTSPTHFQVDIQEEQKAINYERQMNQAEGQGEVIQ